MDQASRVGYEAAERRHCVCLNALKRERVPPVMAPVMSNWSSRYFPKRDELSFITVLALPNASNMGLTCGHRKHACVNRRIECTARA